MQNFSFHNPVKILFGKGQIAAVALEIPPAARILMTYGGGSIKKNGVHEQVTKALSGRTVFEFGGIEPNPTYETLMKAVALARTEKIDFLLAVGGGSVLDGTKFIAAAIPFAGEPWDILSKGAPVDRAVPMGSVLTLPATGSEMNAFAVISRTSTTEKLAFGSPLVMPTFSVLDPMTTSSLPPRQVGNGIVDAFVHVCEQYLTVRTGAEVQDRMSEAVLSSLIDIGPSALVSRDDEAVLGTVMWAATQALNGNLGVGVPQDWATHTIGHEITALTGMDHARTLAIVLPSLLGFQRKVKGPKLVQYAERVWGITAGDDNARIDGAIEKTRTFFESMGVPTRFKDHGIGPDIAEKVAQRLGKGNARLGEDKGITADGVRTILERAL